MLFNQLILDALAAIPVSAAVAAIASFRRGSAATLLINFPPDPAYDHVRLLLKSRRAEDSPLYRSSN
ncbi:MULTISPECIES: hypothetical protein [unclassified Bradyrhizobium]|uniref:hypothetical protein n=1 Tax=unclassified Bradyrhizobium TaxID=2631580 RepID=UPI0029170A75|nr:MULTISPECIES: hypothetical protein [unclassified Bradyrhizobium]